jgi:hypothetical protein
MTHTKSLGLNPKEQKQWIRKLLLQYLSDHLISQDKLDCIGINNIVDYLKPLVFAGAEKEEEWALKFSLCPYPGHGNVHKVLILSKEHKMVEAIETAFMCARERQCNSYLNAFLQDAAIGQKGLGVFVKRHLSCSDPSRVAMVIRMRRYAIDTRVLGVTVDDNPKSIEDHYHEYVSFKLFLDIMEELADKNNYDKIKFSIMDRVINGDDKESILKAGRQLQDVLNSTVKEQSIPPSIKEFDGIVFEIVPKTSPFVFQAHEINDSCMSIGGVAEDCVLDILSNPRACLLIIRSPDVVFEYQSKCDSETFKKHRKKKLKNGYFGYCYIRHGLSGNVYVDNVELIMVKSVIGSDTELINKDLPSGISSGLVKWVRWIAAELNAPKVFIGKKYSQRILDESGFVNRDITTEELEKDMPEGTVKYDDIHKGGCWVFEG